MQCAQRARCLPRHIVVLIENIYMSITIGGKGWFPVVPGRKAQAGLGGKTRRVCSANGEERPGDARKYKTAEQRDAPGASRQVRHTLLLCRDQIKRLMHILS